VQPTDCRLFLRDGALQLRPTAAMWGSGNVRAQHTSSTRLTKSCSTAWVSSILPDRISSKVAYHHTELKAVSEARAVDSSPY